MPVSEDEEIVQRNKSLSFLTARVLIKSDTLWVWNENQPRISMAQNDFLNSGKLDQKKENERIEAKGIAHW